MSTPLLHMCTDAQWHLALDAGEIRAESPDPQRFLHLSTPQQVHLPANRLYSGRTDLVLLCVDPGRLDSEIRWEPGIPGDPASMRFPHLYGPLPTASVVAVLDYRPDATGHFEPPIGVPVLT
ncbi:MAG: DUF952 domain-containing protein [Mycobacteriaceae bacterium]